MDKIVLRLKNGLAAFAVPPYLQPTGHASKAIAV